MGNIDNFDLAGFAGDNIPVVKPQEQTNISQSVQVTTNSDDSVRADIERVGKLIKERGIDITSGYQNWRNVGFVLTDVFGESGRPLFHDLSRMNAEYNAAECDKQYTACLKSNGSGITPNTFFQLAKDAGIDLSEIGRQKVFEQSVSPTSAIQSSEVNKEKVVNNNILPTFDTEKSDGGLTEVTETTKPSVSCYTFSDKLKAVNLFGIMKTIYDLFKGEIAKCDAMLIGALNIISGLMGGANGDQENPSGIYGIYDGRKVFANLYNIILGAAGSDKGSLIFCKWLARPVKMLMRRQYEAEMQQYEQDWAEYEGQNKKERGPAPKEPAYQDPFVPGNSSSSAVYRAMEANGGWGMMFETEADTISSMLASDYGNFSDLMRKAHHHETISMGRVTEKLHIEIDEPRLSNLLTCTPGQLKGLFPSFENGLGSRFPMYILPDEEVKFHNVFAFNDNPLEETFKKLGDQLLPLYHALKDRVGHPIQFVMSKSQQQMFLDTYGDMLHEQFHILGKGITAFVLRQALACFRYAMILTTLRRLAEWQEHFDPSDADQEPIFKDIENALECDDRDFETAMTIVGCLINHTARVYSVLASEDDDIFALDGSKITSVEKAVYNALPSGDFRTAQFLEIAKSKNVKQKTAERMLGNFWNKYQIVSKVSQGVYHKP